jgi:putative hemolysin
MNLKMSESQLQAVEQKIDVGQILKAKNPGAARLIPTFVIRYLKRIIHQDEINAFLSVSDHKVGLDFVDAVLDMFQPDLKIIGDENLLKQTRIIVASNHPLGGLDGLALMQSIGKHYSYIQFPVNDILLFIKNLKPLFVPINKHGSNADNIRIFNDTFLSDAVICYFPFGLVSRKRKGIIRDLEWKKTFLSKAKKFQRDIIPTHISGRNSDFFYNLSNIRKKLGIKVNIEMLYLVNEFFKQKNNEIRITFGQPISWKFFDKRFTDVVWAEKLRLFIYYMATHPDAIFDPETDYAQLI